MSAATSEANDDVLSVVRNGRDLATMHIPPLRWAVHGLVPEGLTLFVGAPKIGKSWAAYDMALAVATGGRALGGIDVHPGRVLYLALEDSDRRLQQRAERLLGDVADLPERFDYATTLQPAALVETLRAWLEKHDDGRLIIVDTLGRVMPQPPPGMPQYQHETRVGAKLKAVADDHNAAIMLVHHDRKLGADDWLDKVSGTNGLTGAADTTILLDRARGESDGIMRVTGRDVEESDYALTSAGGLWQITDAPPTDPNLGALSARIVRHVDAHPDGVRAADIADALDLTTANARDYLARLSRHHHITKRDRGLYTPVVSVASVVSNPHNTTDTTDTTGGEGDP